jgi:hypothetical protein
MPTIQKNPYWIQRIASRCKIKTPNDTFFAIFQLALERRFHRDPVNGMRIPAPSFKGLADNIERPVQVRMDHFPACRRALRSILVPFGPGPTPTV